MVCGVVLPMILIAFSRCSRFVVVSLLTLLQKLSYASFVLGLHPFSDGCVWGLSSMVCWLSVCIVQVILHMTYQWSDMARSSSFGCCTYAWPGVPKNMNM